ncbi:MAG TPA: hypothetical protein VK879_13435 [Candidatus Sulfomarinibacteraceae bacterium]|nr:hypothetical protein [Candidatus Sulfomarinibacteraceae bacterium]
MNKDNFAFVIHPIDPRRDIGRKYPALAKLPVWLLELLSIFYPPVYLSEVTGIRSAHNGRALQGWLLACPLTPRLMISLPPAVVYHKIVQVGRLAERLGARLLGLGAFTSVAGDGGQTIARRLDIPVTTGDSYTVAMAVRAIRQAAYRMHLEMETETVAIVGAYGAIGRVCAQMLAPQSGRLLLIGRDQGRLAAVADEIQSATAASRQIELAADIERLSDAALIVTVTSAVDAVIEPQHLRPGAIVCDVARPRDVSRQVAEQRPDVLVIEGGMVRVPGPVDFGFDFGFPPGMAYACMAETMALALEGRYESYTLGKQIELARVLAIDKIAHTHGFTLGGFRSFERAIPEAEISAIYARALAGRASPGQQVAAASV